MTAAARRSLLKVQLRTRLALLAAALAAVVVAAPAAAQYETECMPNTLCISDVSVDEGNSGASLATFTVTISPARANAVDVTYMTMPGEGTATPGSDYTGVTSGTVRIPAGQTSATISVTIIGDTTPEPNESFFVHLADSAVAISKHHGAGTIMDDDSAPGTTPPPPPPPPGGGYTGPDTRAPNTYIHGGPGRVTRARTASFHVASTEAGSRFQCKLDGAAWRGCRASLTLRRLRVGLHTFRARAIDAAGNVDRTPAAKTWRVRR